MPSTRVTGIGLLSGGLDSILAVKVLQEQDNIHLIGITFSTPFFSPEAGVKAGGLTGIEVRVMDISAIHLQMLRNPKYGYGSQMNPCIDCHALMLHEAGRLMEQERAHFLFTGEVLGQRPMSQRRDSLRSVEKLSGFPGRVLRPLSARLLPPTTPEVEGLIDRDRLLDVHGRSRKRQMELAVRYGIKDYPQPGGGCLLTKEGFARRLRELMRLFPEAAAREVELLKWGRHFLLPQGHMCTVGRKQADNQKIESLASREDVLLRVMDYPSPTALILAPSLADEAIPMAARLLVSYSDAPAEGTFRVEWRHRDESGIIQADNPGKDHFKGYLI